MMFDVLGRSICLHVSKVYCGYSRGGFECVGHLMFSLDGFFSELSRCTSLVTSCLFRIK